MADDRKSNSNTDNRPREEGAEPRDASEHVDVRSMAEANERLLVSALREQKLAENAQRVAEELKESERLRAQYVSLLSHDLMGPLFGARIAGEMLLAAEDPVRRRQAYDRLEANLARMHQMIRDMLDAGRIRSGHALLLKPAPCELTQLLRKAVEDLDAADAYRIELHADEPVHGVWSAAELTRAIWNLIRNALKYGAEDSAITVTVKREGDKARVSVHNVGNPISQQDQDLLFAPFARTAAGSRISTGWGLGLTLVAGCAQAHGGRVTLTSSPEAGTTFGIELPLDATQFVPS